jgi:hypothetical protein
VCVSVSCTFTLPSTSAATIPRIISVENDTFSDGGLEQASRQTILLAILF